MKIFIDTNLFLDIILSRDGYDDAVQILNSCSNGMFEGYVSDITLLNIDYIAHKQVKNIEDFLKTIVSVFKVVGADNTTFDEAFKINNKDFEDSIQYVCAKENECEVIVSNDKHFYKGSVEVMDSSEFSKRYLKK